MLDPSDPPLFLLFVVFLVLLQQGLLLGPARSCGRGSGARAAGTRHAAALACCPPIPAKCTRLLQLVRLDVILDPPSPPLLLDVHVPLIDDGRRRRRGASPRLPHQLLKGRGGLEIYARPSDIRGLLKLACCQVVLDPLDPFAPVIRGLLAARCRTRRITSRRRDPVGPGG